MTSTRKTNTRPPADQPAADEQADATEPVTRTVHITDPGRGPVYVDDGPPLTHPDTRSVSDTPLIRAYLDSGVLAETSRPSGKETT